MPCHLQWVKHRIPDQNLGLFDLEEEDLGPIAGQGKCLCVQAILIHELIQVSFLLFVENQQLG